jgi:hypothetical protein
LYLRYLLLRQRTNLEIPAGFRIPEMPSKVASNPGDGLKGSRRLCIPLKKTIVMHDFLLGFVSRSGDSKV